MAKDYGHTVVLVTHNAAVAPAADRIIRLRDGEVSEIMDQKILFLWRRFSGNEIFK